MKTPWPIIVIALVAACAPQQRDVPVSASDGLYSAPPAPPPEAHAEVPVDLAVYAISEPFNPGAFSWSMNQGTASIAGRAALKGSDGRVHTCAGNVVALTADNAYSREGADAAKTGQFGRIERDPRYFRYRRTTTCDESGRFAFRHLPHGNWGIGTRVEWHEGDGNGGVSVNGGPLGKRLSLRSGQEATVVFTDRDL